MKKILITGSSGFIGSHLKLALMRKGGYEVIEFGSDRSLSELDGAVDVADGVVHLAGVNRPENESDFEKGNADFTRHLCQALEASRRKLPLIVSSTIQVERDNPYGRSKLAAEKAVNEYFENTGADVSIYRLPNVFGKWTRPNYNTVVATFCHNICRDLPVSMSDPETVLQFVYIDDVITEFVRVIENGGGVLFAKISPVHGIKLGELHDRIRSFRDCRSDSLVPDLGDPLTKALYSTYLSFLGDDDLAYPVDLKTDDRGWLFELVKTERSGQIFVSKTSPGITRGNHYHDTKVEKFCVIQGQGVVRFRHVLGEEIIEYPVNDEVIKVVDIPPGLTHSIENTGEKEMITIFWANEVFNPDAPDTYWEPVLPEPDDAAEAR